MAEQSPTGAVLVVGAGIGGMQASLELAESGFKVYLLDEQPSIGGVMSMLGKTFPTNDCSMCILSPKLVGTGRHPNIELLTYSRLLGLEGEPGRFKAKIRRKARYVDLDKCTGCMDCAKACPVNAISGAKKQVHVIDTEICVKCSKCISSCNFGAVYKN